MTTSRPPDSTPAPRWASHVFVALGAVLVPWTLWLAATLPERHVARNFDVAWSGFDIAIAATLIATGYGLFKGAAWTQGVAAAAATLLITDAWFDVLTSAPGAERLMALAMAVFAEVPVAVACGMIAFRASSEAERAHRAQALMHRVFRRRAAPAAATDAASSD